MKHVLIIWALLLSMFLCGAEGRAGESPFPARFSKPAPITMAELAKRRTEGVSVVEVSDYVYGNYQGKLTSPPSADLNPKKAFVIFWKDFPQRFVFAHEQSYCPFFELPGGAGISYQFFEGNECWAELMNQWGRQERNSFVDVMEAGPRRVWIRWTYFGVNMTAGQPAYRATEDFWAHPNGLILRRQSFRTLLPGQNRGYAFEPIELIGMCPVGKRWFDVLQKNPASEERHALAVLDAFSPKRYDLYWTPKPGTLWQSTHRQAGCTWKEVDDAAGVALVMPLKDGAAFCIVGDASGYRHDYTCLVNHTYGGYKGMAVWGSACWDHWPIGWVNSQGHLVDEDSLRLYPNSFSAANLNILDLPNDVRQRGSYYSVVGIGGNMEAIRTVARRWLEKGTGAISQPDSVADLPAPMPPAAAAAGSSSAGK